MPSRLLDNGYGRSGVKTQILGHSGSNRRTPLPGSAPPASSTSARSSFPTALAASGQAGPSSHRAGEARGDRREMLQSVRLGWDDSNHLIRTA